jgi:hypothetical protein
MFFQLCKICPVAEDNLILQTHEEVRGPAAGKDLSCHQNTRTVSFKSFLLVIINTLLMYVKFSLKHV